LLLTNDGGLKRRLELPATGWLRRYRVRVHGRVEESALASLAAGMTVDGFRYGPIDARLERIQGSNAWLGIALREGKNREIRRVLEHFGLRVTRLIRVSFGPFQLGGLQPGALDEVSGKVLREQLGGTGGPSSYRNVKKDRARIQASRSRY
jgi:23S rRNA pseudouridine2605 synthase